MASRSIEDKQAHTGSILNLLTACEARLAGIHPRGRRYTDKELDYFTYKYVQCGKSAYEFEHANSVSPDIRTCQQHLKKMSRNVKPDCLRLPEFSRYLELNDLPRVFVLSEDATRISGGVSYNSIKDEIYGLVPPVDTNGMPIRNFFVASSPAQVKEFLQRYPVGRNLYVTMAQPLKSGSEAFCLMFTCSDNRFTTKDVLRRWKHTEEECKKLGILMICRASDGDPRLVQAMMNRMRIPIKDENRIGEWFFADCSTDNICIQDTTHLVNKFRVRLMKQDRHIIIGI